MPAARLLRPLSRAARELDTVLQLLTPSPLAPTRRAAEAAEAAAEAAEAPALRAAERARPRGARVADAAAALLR